jgi:hypothetical protein
MDCSLVDLVASGVRSELAMEPNCAAVEDNCHHNSLVQPKMKSLKKCSG